VYGSKIGWYHLIFLPLILLEMESGGPSFLGALVLNLTTALPAMTHLSIKRR
jgi:hypothetical protein